MADQSSGLRAPERAARGLAAMAMGFEALSLLLAIVPMRMLLDDATFATVVVLVLTVACIALAGLARRPWVWPAGAVVQLVLIACWPIHWALGAAGLVFALVWGYCWHVKIQLAKPPKR